MAEAATPRSGWGPRGGNEASIRADGLSGLRCDVRRKGRKQRLLSFSSWWQGIEAASFSKCTVRNWEARGFAERGGTGSGDGQDGGSRTGPRISADRKGGEGGATERPRGTRRQGTEWTGCKDTRAGSPWTAVACGCRGEGAGPVLLAPERTDWCIPGDGTVAGVTGGTGCERHQHQPEGPLHTAEKG